MTVVLARRLLADAPWAQERLRPFAGQSIGWDIAGVQGSVVLDAEGLPAVPPADAEPAATPAAAAGSAPARPARAGVRVTLAAADLPRLAEGMDRLMRHVVIEGNAGLAGELAFVARNLQVDPADWLAPYLGDVLAQRTSDGLKSGAVAALRTLRRAAQAGAEFAVHEARLLTDRSAVAGHCRQVDEVREAADRLAQRIARLERGGRP